MSETSKTIEQRIRSHFSITHLELIDDSAAHTGHAGAQGGAGHYKLTLVSPSFQGKTAVERHRQIYAILGDMVGHAIHAINIDAKTPEEWEKITEGNG